MNFKTLFKTQKRPLWAFFCLALPVWSLGAEQLTNSTCSTEESGHTATVTKVIDGDTVIIGTGDHVRLIGIDTPEIDYKTGKAEAGAIAARDALQAMIARQQQALLIFDQQRVDQYGRTLAHLFLADGTNVQASLLAQGLAVPFPYPPDLKFVDCYHEASTTAMQAKRGLWQSPDYQPVWLDKTPTLNPGYHTVIAKVLSIRKSKQTLTLVVRPDFSLKIQKEDWKYFDNMDINGLVSTLIQVQGELYARGKEVLMRVRHPSAITLLPPEHEH